MMSNVAIDCCKAFFSLVMLRYNLTPRSDLVAGKDAKWLLVSVEDLKLAPIQGDGPHGPGTFLKILREADMWAAKDRAHEIWMKIQRVCRQLR